MERKIKFRAWDNKGKVMLDWLCIRQSAFNRGEVQLMYDIFTAPSFVDDCGYILMQYTGLKDINNAEVYEGDYFETEEGLMEVFFIDGKFILMWADNGTYRCDLCDAVKTLSKCGNKFESPELLPH